MHVSSLPLHILRVDSLAHLDVDEEIVTSAKEIAKSSVVRSSNLISGKSPEESPPKFRRKLPVPMPKWAGQVSPCNDVSQSFGEADVNVMPPAAEPWDKLRGAAQRCIRAHKAGLSSTLEPPGNSMRGR